MSVGVRRFGSDVNAPIAFATADAHRPPVNTAAIIGYAGVPILRHCLGGIAWSYAGTPVGGTVTLEDGAGTPVLQLDIMNSGAGSVHFARPVKSSAAHLAMVITLTPGGAGVTGKVNALGHWIES